MNTRKLVDPQLLPNLDAFPAMTFSQDTLQAVREMMASIIDMAPTPDAPVDFEQRKAPSLDGSPEIPVHIYRPRGATGALPGFFHIHGGGYVGGTPTMSDAQNRIIADALRCVVVSVDYRLAPETPFPG